MSSFLGIKLLSFLQLAVAVPKWHEPNDYDLNGEPCVGPTVPVDCPVLCSVDPALHCPEAHLCAEELQLCQDGLCYPQNVSCVEVAGGNPCSCDQDQSSSLLLPCPVPAGPFQMPNFHQDHVISFCASVYNVSGHVALAEEGHVNSNTIAAHNGSGNESGLSLVWVDCAAHVATRGITLTGRETGFVIMYLLWGFFGALNLIWYMFKKAKETPIKLLEQREEHRDADVRHQGYRMHWAGRVLYVYMILLALAWHVWMLIFCLDYYAYFEPMLLGSYANLYLMFMLTWHFMTLTIVLIKLFSSHIFGFYSLRTSFAQATHIQVWHRDNPAVFLADDDYFMSLAQRLKQGWVFLFGETGQLSNERIDHTPRGLLYYEHECVRYAYDSELETFQAGAIPHNKSLEGDYQKGLSSSEVSSRRDLVGNNLIKVHVDTWPLAIWHEFSSEYYIYQLVMLWVYYFWSYRAMGLFNTVVIVLSGLVRAYLKRSSELNIKAMAEQTGPCTILRDGEWKVLKTVDLVPGDVFVVDNKVTVPCDAVLINGDCVLDESNLTGESHPIQKFCWSCEDEGEGYEKMTTGKKNTLFAGTTVVQTIPAQDLSEGEQEEQAEKKVLALALDIAAQTEKGQLVSSILFESAVVFVFDEHLKLVFCILVVWASVVFGLTVYFQNSAGAGAWLIGIFCVAQIFSPLLPSAFVVSQAISAERLVQRRIRCVDLRRITISGKVKLFCFDKTGTLTKEGLDFSGVQPVLETAIPPTPSDAGDSKVSTFDFDNIRQSGAPWHGLPVIHLALATTHSLAQASDQLVGNTVDREMFRASGWSFGDKMAFAGGSGLSTLFQTFSFDALKDESASRRARVLRRFAFDHKRMSMSVIVHDMDNNLTYIFAKGSAERTSQICLAHTLPSSYQAVSEQRAAEGFYTLAIAVRNLGQYNSRLEQDLAAWTRDEVEYNLSFLTLLLFRNNIKDDTAEAITKLKKGGIRPIMITGDNALTAMYIAKEGNLVSKSAAMIYGQLVKESKHGTRGSGGASEEASKPARTSEVNESVLNPTAQQQAHTSPLLLDDEAAAVLPLASDYGAVASSSGHFLRQQTSSMIEMKNVHEDLSEGLDLGDVVWTDMRDGTCLELDSVLSSVAEMNSVKDEVESSALELSFRRDIEVVVTGAVFEILQKRYPEVLHRLLLHIRIFARMTPMAKVDCVQLHMARGITAMCGDGGNDCGALRTAHVGIAMSNAEASIVSPFSTADRSVHSVIEMLKEGRAAVATSFSLYRYLIICGEAIIFAKLCYAYFSVALSQWTYIVIDSFLALGFVYTLSQAKPSAALWPRRPTAKLLGPETALSCTAVVLTNAAFLFMGVAWLFSQPWFVCHEFDARTTPDILKWWLLADNFEGELLGFLVLFQCCTAALIGAFGYQYRESWYKNWQFVSVFTVFCLLFSYMMLGNPSRLGCWFRFQCGDPDKLVDLGYFTNSSQIVWPIPAYNTPLHHNVMPASFRAKMFFYALTNSLLVIVGYRYFVLGRGREMIRRSFPG